MPALGNEMDANFFNLIHTALGSQKKSDTERRENPRQTFQSQQRIALPRQPGIPPESEFFDVRCRDLTRQGFSFLLAFEPKFKRLVAAFGAPPDAIYLSAQVTHCADVLLYPSGVAVPLEESDDQSATEAATPMTLVGCRFIERLYR